jgi:Putative auto-transporter adhesin, head GIN domain
MKNDSTKTLPVRRSIRASALALGCAATVLAATLSQPAAAASESRSVAGFDRVLVAVPGEVEVQQGPHETLTLEAEPEVLGRITTEVRDGRLVIGLAPGRIETRQPIRMQLEVRSLRAFESRGAGSTAIGPLHSEALTLVLAGGGSIRLDRLEDARKLDVRIVGAGNVGIGGGKVTAQQLSISGVGGYRAFGLASESADVAIDGNGEAQLAASSTLAVRIGGIGHVRYHGDPAVQRSVRGIGSIEKD